MLPNILKPQYSIKSNLIRIGPKKDGGYIVDKRVIKKTSKIITCGLHDDWDFEKEFLSINKKCTVSAYDHTVNNSFWLSRFKKDILSFFKLKKLTPKKILDIFKFIDYYFFFSKKNIHHKKKIVLIKKNKKEITIKEILKNLKNIILKIDIEGDEYKILSEINKNQKKINLLIIELHYISKNILKIKKFLSKSNLKIIHIHANNYGGLDKKNLPTTLELSLLNSKKFKISKKKSTYSYPITKLDYKNHKSKDDIKLSFND
ncbi:FkbM family methyltransferase [Candidatus Pelagibacter sp.]|uniref:FkbM family methyltransferase n=1 Tax=Candidatus Pelagibacter sp. TaxID=2024849 RepID=UPI003F8596C3